MNCPECGFVNKEGEEVCSNCPHIFKDSWKSAPPERSAGSNIGWASIAVLAVVTGAIIMQDRGLIPGGGSQALAAQAPQLSSLREKPYVILYGRTNCGYCQGLMSELDNRGVAYTFKSIDETSNMNEITVRMEASGIDTGSFGLPVVDVNARIYVRPSINTVQRDLREFPKS